MDSTGLILTEFLARMTPRIFVGSGKKNLSVCVDLCPPTGGNEGRRAVFHDNCWTAELVPRLQCLPFVERSPHRSATKERVYFSFCAYRRARSGSLDSRQVHSRRKPGRATADIHDFGWPFRVGVTIGTFMSAMKRSNKIAVVRNT